MTEFVVENNGISLAVPAGEHIVSAAFIETNTEKTANWISLAGIGVLFIGIIAAWKIKKL
jgi:LPXTG-motif cell wall-anchored protein